MTSEQTRELVNIAAIAADDKGGEDLVALDVSQPLPLVDAFLIVTGRNERNVGQFRMRSKRNFEHGVKRLRREGRQEGRWVLMDFGDLVVHVFHEEERMYYGLERLWKDCPVIPIEIPTRTPAEAN